MKLIYTCIVGLCLVCISSFASADSFLSDIEAEVGYYNIAYNEENIDNQGYRFRLGHKAIPVYVWYGAEEETDIREGGQSVASSDNKFIGLGANFAWQKMSVFLEVGYGETDDKSLSFATHEMAFVELERAGLLPTADGTPVFHGRDVGDTGQWPAYDSGAIFPGGYEGEYDLDDGFVGRLGIEYQIWEHLKVSASYRYFEVDETYTLKPNRSDEVYSETFTRELSAWEMGVFLTF